MALARAGCCSNHRCHGDGYYSTFCFLLNLHVGGRTNKKKVSNYNIDSRCLYNTYFKYRFSPWIILFLLVTALGKIIVMIILRF